MSKPRIAVCITRYERGGQSVVINEQTRALSELYEFTVLTEDQRMDPPSWLRVKKTAPWLGRYNPIPRKAFRNELDHFDLVHCHDSFAFILESSKSRTPLVVTSHGNCPPQFRDTNKLKFEYHVSEPLYGLAYRKAAAVVTISRHLKDWLLRRYGINAVLCTNGVDLKKFNVQNLIRSRAFLYVGELSKRKGIPALLNAFREFRRLEPDYELWIAGFGPMSKEIERLGSRSNIKLLGFVPDDELARTYGRAKAFVTPSYWEGFGLPILESMATGTPVVARRAFAITELLEEQNFGFLFEDDTNLVDSLHEAARSCTRSLSAGARQASEQYSWAKSAEILKEVYANVLRNS